MIGVHFEPFVNEFKSSVYNDGSASLKNYQKKSSKQSQLEQSFQYSLELFP